MQRRSTCDTPGFVIGGMNSKTLESTPDLYTYNLGTARDYVSTCCLISDNNTDILDNHNSNNVITCIERIPVLVPGLPVQQPARRPAGPRSRSVQVRPRRAGPGRAGGSRDSGQAGHSHVTGTVDRI